MKTKIFTFLLMSIIMTGINSCSKRSSYLSPSDISEGINNTAGNNGNASTQGANEVWMKSMSFSPSVITITPGTTITWISKDGYPYNVKSNTELFKSKELKTNEVFSYTFNNAGHFDYYCTFYVQMTGTIIVK